MKKVLAWSFAFFIILFASDRLIGFALNAVLKQSSFRFSKVYTGQVVADVVILGNSRGVNSFYQPDLETALNKKVFNLSYNGLRVDIARVLLEDYLLNNAKPSIVILEASMLTKSFPELVKEFKPYVKSDNQVGMKMKELYPDIYNGVLVSQVFRYNSELFLRSLYFLNKDDQAWINQGTITPELEADLQAYQGTNFDIDNSLLHDLVEIRKLCERHGILLKVVIAPYLPAYASKITNLISWKHKVDSTLNGIKVSDYAASIPGSNNFADWVHLNKDGSRIFLDTLLHDNFFKP